LRQQMTACVGRQGIEPWATRLKVGDSATELTARATRAGPVSTSSRLPPRSSESQHRTDDLPIMSRALWPTELSRHSWPPRDRTAQYLRIRQAPSTSWVVASGEGESRTRKAEAQLLSGQIPSPIGLPLHGGRRRTRISGPSGPHPLSRRGPPPGDFISHERRAENSNPTPKCALVSGEARHPGRFALLDYLVPFRGFEPRTS
jgi:hypothetical protein